MDQVFVAMFVLVLFGGAVIGYLVREWERDWQKDYEPTEDGSRPL